jgi:hypothetical protein
VAAILDLLRSQSDRLYALLDAARHDDVLTLLYGFSPEMRSLYEGESEARLGKSGPYLVSLSSQDDLLKALLRKGWGQAWGVFLTSQGNFAEVRRHLRTLLMVKRERDGSEMYFRFYDPRVLSVFLPTCSPVQLRQLFGPVSAYLMEAERGAVLLRFTAGAERASSERLELAAQRSDQHA